MIHSNDAITFIDLLIAFGGLSRSLYYIGLVFAQFIAKMMYERTIIEELYQE